MINPEIQKRYQTVNPAPIGHTHYEGVRSFAEFCQECQYIGSRVAYAAMRASHPRFTYQGRSLPYFSHRYNMTWRSERTVEIPIIWDLFQSSRGSRILEVGNVLSHYHPTSHDIVDKYESGPRVINQDVADFAPTVLYDLVVSVSTFEHMGRDEEIKDPDKPIRVLKYVRDHCLTRGGRIVITIPIGYNAPFDAQAFQHNPIFTTLHSLRRISKWNLWEEVDLVDLRHVKFGHPFPFANGLVIATVQKSLEGN